MLIERSKILRDKQVRKILITSNSDVLNDSSLMTAFKENNIRINSVIPLTATNALNFIKGIIPLKPILSEIGQSTFN